MSFINQLLKNLKKEKFILFLRDNIWGVYLADIQSLSKYNKGNKYLLCAIDLFSKYAWVIPIKDKKGTSIVNAFQKIISEGRKMYSTYNEEKSVVAARFIRTLKNNIFKHMTAISQNVYFDVLDDIVNKYNNTVHRTIKLKLIEVTDDSFPEYNEDFNKKDPKLKVGDRVRISKYRNIFPKGYTPNWLEEDFVVSKIKNTVPWTYVISDLNGKEITGNLYEKLL